MIGQSQSIPESFIWSAGIVLFNLATGILPFSAQTPEKLETKILNKSNNIPSSVSPGLSDLLRKMLEKNLAARITLEEIKEHPWATKYAFESVC
jgi:serine/threonine protein kinase